MQREYIDINLEDSNLIVKIPKVILHGEQKRINKYTMAMMGNIPLGSLKGKSQDEIDKAMNNIVFTPDMLVMQEEGKYLSIISSVKNGEEELWAGKTDDEKMAVLDNMTVQEHAMLGGKIDEVLNQGKAENDGKKKEPSSIEQA